jgi:hypothetical protein
MSRETHVRFWERAAVKIRRATRLLQMSIANPLWGASYSMAVSHTDNQRLKHEGRKDQAVG